MILNDPPIYLSVDSNQERSLKQELTEKFDFWIYNQSDYYCIDGFTKSG